MMFLKPEVRKSLLAKMLSELLDTRVMVKGSMKAVASDRVSHHLSASRTERSPVLTISRTIQALTKLLNARQLALKFLANVTYGYTSATFSGRMPAVEVADAIVQTGRETLERVSSDRCSHMSEEAAANHNCRIVRLSKRFATRRNGRQKSSMAILILSSSTFPGGARRKRFGSGTRWPTRSRLKILARSSSSLKR